MPYRRFYISTGPSRRSGFSRIELIVLIFVTAIFIGTGYFWISSYLKRTGTARGVECARTINTLFAQYATDNNGVYPVGEGTPAVGKSEGIARNLLENNYTPNAAIFAVGSTPRYGGENGDFSGIGPANISWDFTAGATASTGLSSDAPDLLPIVYTTGQIVAYPTTPGAGLNLPFSDDGPFAKKGMAVAYKDGHAAFIQGTSSGSTLECEGFISPALQDTGPYTQIKP